MDPHPIKHHAVLLARIRNEIEPILLAAGFQLDTRNDPRPGSGPNLWIGYRRGAELFNLRYKRTHSSVGLDAELLDRDGNVDVLADATFPSAPSYELAMGVAEEFVEQLSDALVSRLAADLPKGPGADQHSAGEPQ